MQPAPKRARGRGAASVVSSAASPSVAEVVAVAIAAPVVAIAPAMPAIVLNVATLKVADLRAELVKRGLPTDGLKPDLVARLIAAMAPVDTEEDHKPRVVVQKRKLSAIFEQETDTVQEPPVVVALPPPTMPVSDLAVDKMTMAQLREALQTRNLATTGLKKALQERLQAALSTPVASVPVVAAVVEATSTVSVDAASVPAISQGRKRKSVATETVTAAAGSDLVSAVSTVLPDVSGRGRKRKPSDDAVPAASGVVAELQSTPCVSTPVEVPVAKKVRGAKAPSSSSAEAEMAVAVPKRSGSRNKSAA